MKNKFYKFFIIISLFTLLFSVLVIPSFADSYVGHFRPGDSFVFSDELLFFQAFSEDVEFTSNGVFYENISVVFRGSFMLEYSNEESVVVVYADGMWVDEAYRTLTFDVLYSPSTDALAFLRENEFIPPSDSLYDTFYDLLVSTIYGDRELTSFETNISTILATIASVCVFAFPLILIFWLIKFLFSLIRRY